MRSIKDQIVGAMEERVTALILHQMRQYHELIVEVQKQTTGRVECDVPYQSSELFTLEVLNIRRLEKELQTDRKRERERVRGRAIN